MGTTKKGAIQAPRVPSAIEIAAVSKATEFNMRMMLAAQLYAKLGFRIVPLLPNKKYPTKKADYQDYQHSTKRIETVTKWFGPGGDFEGWNIGVACGASDSPLFVIDVDHHTDEADGLATWATLQQEYGDVLAPAQNTPSGGRHLFFK